MFLFTRRTLDMIASQAAWFLSITKNSQNGVKNATTSAPTKHSRNADRRGDADDDRAEQHVTDVVPT